MDRVALIFPGQGSQYVGMGIKLCSEFDIAKETFNEANEILKFDLKKLCYYGSSNELNKYKNMCYSLLTLSMAVFKVYTQEIGLLPVLSGGYGLGEYSALMCSGAIKFSDALKIIKHTSENVQQIANSRLGTIGVISPSDFLPAKVMNSAIEFLRQTLLTYKFHDFKFPVISNLYKKPYENAEEMANGLAIQMTKPVQCDPVIESLNSYGATIAIEIGLKSGLMNLVKENTKKIKTFTLGNYGTKDKISLICDNQKSDLLKCHKTVSHSIITTCLAMAVSTRNENFNEEEYRLGVIMPYEKIEKIENSIHTSGADPTYKQINEVLNLLKVIYDTKKVSIDQQYNRFKRIFHETDTPFMFSDFELFKSVFNN